MNDTNVTALTDAPEIEAGETEAVADEDVEADPIEDAEEDSAAKQIGDAAAGRAAKPQKQKGNQVY
jgi:hypothetical protein